MEIICVGIPSVIFEACRRGTHAYTQACHSSPQPIISMLCNYQLLTLLFITSLIYCSFNTTLYKPIRVHFDTTFFTQDETNRSCSTVGALYKRGDPSNLDETCNEARTKDCWGVCTQSDVITPLITSLIQDTLLPYLREKISEIFHIIPVQNPLLAQPGRCGLDSGVPIPNEYVTTGVNADLVVFITSRPMHSGQDVNLVDHLGITGGIDCQSDPQGRPIFGHLNIAPKIIGQLANIQKAATLHEMLHIMGFSMHKFPQYRDPQGNVRQNVILQEQRTHKGEVVTIKFLNLPTPLEFVRKHFACASIQGLELEDVPGFESHLEKRVFMNELMTADFTLTHGGDGPVLSEITLGIFQDSGWYQVNFSSAERYIWGRGFGCKLVQDRCENWGVQANRDGLGALIELTVVRIFLLSKGQWRF